MTSDIKKNINNAFALLQQAQGIKPEEAVSMNSIMPTARTRKALDLLSFSNPQQLLKEEVDLRQLCQDLFNWDEKGNRVNKVLIRTLNEWLNTPGKYDSTVEMTAYLAAAAPLLGEADRIARMYNLLDETVLTFAPAKYTMQLANKLETALEGFPVERQETLLRSLWTQTHNGPWWDVTLGDAYALAQAADEEVVLRKRLTKEEEKDLVNDFCDFTIVYTRQKAHDFTLLKENDDIRNALSEFRDVFLSGRGSLNPDVALLSASIPWLTVTERTESPIGSIVSALNHLMEHLEDYNYPKKPKAFNELFPPVTLYGGKQFPHPDLIIALPRFKVGKNMFTLVRNQTQLSENRTYMGNCTWTYKPQMEEGKYVLYIIENPDYDTRFNAAMTVTNGRWTYREINSRHNGGNVPADVRAAFEEVIERAGAYVENSRYEAMKEAQDALVNFSYKYSI